MDSLHHRLSLYSAWDYSREHESDFQDPYAGTSRSELNQVLLESRDTSKFVPEGKR